MPKIINIAGHLEMNLTIDQSVIAKLMIGRLTIGAPVVSWTTAANVVDNATPIPLDYIETDQGLHRVGAQTTVVEGTFDQSDGLNGTFETNPIAIFWEIENRGGNVDLNHLRASLSIYSYEGREADMLTIDPGR